MRIAQIAPPWEPVPPAGYGGTERVVQYLTDELVRAGHEVTLFASGDSTTPAKLHAVSATSLRSQGIHLHDGAPFFVDEVEQVRHNLDDFDVIHGHIDYFAFPLGRIAGAPPVVHTLHGRLDLPHIKRVFEQFNDQPLVSISNSQRTPLPRQHWAATIYHGLPMHLYRASFKPNGYLLFLGRMSMEKRPDWAIEIAQRAGLPLVMAAKVDLHDREYFDSVVRPLLKRAKNVEFIGEVNDEQKNELLGGAAAMLMPIDWPEPFGLTAIEAFACGTPVIGRPCGALPELVTHGVDGFLHDDINTLADLVANRIGDLDRSRCRETFEKRFTAPIMAAEYVRVFEEIVRSRDAAKAAASAEGAWVTVDNALAASIPKHVLKGNHAYAVTDPLGDVPRKLRGEFGFYNRGTRYLSDLELAINGHAPCLLSSAYHPDKHAVVIDLGNEHIVLADGTAVPQNSVHIRRELTIVRDQLNQRLRITSFSNVRIPLTLRLRVAVDFADMFEVRGTMRKHRGRSLGVVPSADGSGGKAIYLGLDGVVRTLAFTFSKAATEHADATYCWTIEVGPGEDWQLEAVFEGNADRSNANFRVLGSHDKLENWTDAAPKITTDDEFFTATIQQALHDLGELMSMGVDGLYPTAGIPWYATLFGRDSIFTALQLIPWRIDTAVSTFFTLAHFQAEAFDDFTDREPGKILHEWREGEMANLREIPFVPYYGTVDATPLFVHLAHEIYMATGDRNLLEQMWPHVARACAWIEATADRNDGLLAYACRSPIGLRNQGWKDSWDCISHADGRLAEGPIALIEAQAYAVMALRDAAALANVRGERDAAGRWQQRAETLSQLTNDLFWMTEDATYGLALDGERNLCRVIGSNAGHALFAGTVSAEQARSIAARLMRFDMVTPFGVRTLSSVEKRFNPMSYHNGSIWPHDNAIIAEGLRRYGLLDEMRRIHSAVLSAVATFPLRRVPELYCGFGQGVVTQPVAYPTACAPQAWSSGTVLWMVRQMIDLNVDGTGRCIRTGAPALPESVSWIRIDNLRAGGGVHSFTVSRDGVEVHERGPFGIVTSESAPERCIATPAGSR
jgi:glycogen debranching enzyme/glycosyltransferase involved in cell wall biosynthesis